MHTNLKGIIILNRNSCRRNTVGQQIERYEPERMQAKGGGGRNGGRGGATVGGRPARGSERKGWRVGSLRKGVRMWEGGLPQGEGAEVGERAASAEGEIQHRNKKMLGALNSIDNRLPLSIPDVGAPIL